MYRIAQFGLRRAVFGGVRNSGACVVGHTAAPTALSPIRIVSRGYLHFNAFDLGEDWDDATDEEVDRAKGLNTMENPFHLNHLTELEDMYEARHHGMGAGPWPGMKTVSIDICFISII
jgi:hypothetical protein